ncbi:DUF3945 domain-containing protein [Sphingobacterium sp. DR205]|uniref:DUF3945 domain-containing protein n=1 Tax=Sphingobacterium sp. DR205 TaxID=2713573 RepID=UPI0013E42B55|nr:DUF3945 domain-containing protein [Sphingobacterium sp. DR205]QIH34462.1 DUF3945 domain-containing protein [Sphingobacterium sp. DR205]
MSTIEKENPGQPEELSDTLLVLDKEKNKIRAVKGIKKNKGGSDPEKGDLETVEPIKKYQNSFLKLNKNDDFLSNFFKNFFSQLDDPTRFNFFKVPIKTAVAIARKMQQFVNTATVKGEELIKGLNAIANPQNNQQTMATQQNSTENSNRYSVDKIDWKSLNDLGWTREEFEKSNLLDSLLKGYKTNDLLPISLKVGNQEFATEAKLWLEQGKDGNAEFKMLCVKKEINWDEKFHGHEFTAEDKANLLQTGNMGRTVNLEMEDNKKIPHLISLDRATKQFISYPTADIRIDDVIKGITLSPEQKNVLLEGKPLYLEGMLSKKDTLFNGEIQFNAFKGHIEFQFNKGNANSLNQEHTETENREIPKVFRRKEFTYDQYTKLSTGHTIYISDFKDAAGKEYPGYVSFNKETHTMDFNFRNPNKIKEHATPAEGHKTQVAVNTEGKTNEATKNLKEPLKSGQTTPVNRKQQQKQNENSTTSRRKGRKV